MICIYEAEIYSSNDMQLVHLFDLEQYTQGHTEEEAIRMAVDLIASMGQDALLHNTVLPQCTHHKSTEHGGKLYVFAVNVCKEDIETVKASRAAEILGVSRGRVSQLYKNGLLEGFKEGRDLFITLDSIQARVDENIKAGRPKTVVS